jgi:hypothetical protein
LRAQSQCQRWISTPEAEAIYPVSKALWRAAKVATGFGLAFGTMGAMLLLLIGHWFGPFKLMAALTGILSLVGARCAGQISYRR